MPKRADALAPSATTLAYHRAARLAHPAIWTSRAPSAACALSMARRVAASCALSTASRRFSAQLSRGPADKGGMLIEVHEGRMVIILVCPKCQRSIAIPALERLKKCDGCGEEVSVPAEDETHPA
jgi:hypothetical protein